MERNENPGDRKQVVQEGFTKQATFKQRPEEGGGGGPADVWGLNSRPRGHLRQRPWGERAQDGEEASGWRGQEGKWGPCSSLRGLGPWVTWGDTGSFWDKKEPTDTFQRIPLARLLGTEARTLIRKQLWSSMSEMRMLGPERSQGSRWEVTKSWHSDDPASALLGPPRPAAKTRYISKYPRCNIYDQLYGWLHSIGPLIKYPSLTKTTLPFFSSTNLQNVLGQKFVFWS